MSVRPIDVTGPVAVGAAELPQRRRWRIAGTLEPWQFFGIVLVFWVYVIAPAALYAYSTGSTFAALTTEAVFAPWRSRVLQHALLFPILLGCYCLSLRLDWKPLWWKLPVQVLMGLGFALMAPPAILWAEVLLMGHKPGDEEWDAPTTLSFWLMLPGRLV